MSGETRMLEFVVYGESGEIVAYCNTYRDAMLVFLGRMPDTALFSERHDERDGSLIVFGYTPADGGKDRVVHCTIKRRMP